MVGIKLKDFQEKCVEELLEQTVFGEKRTILLQAPTGSGKTVILLEYIDRYLLENKNYVFVWLTPGSGELEEQSMKKMNALLKHRETKTLADVLNNGFEDGDTAFINWETVTKKGNTALKELEKSNLYDRIDEAKSRGINFLVIVDEEHRNKTEKSSEIVDMFNPGHIVRVSATTKKDEHAYNIKISEMDVINSGLITKSLYINQGIENDILLSDEIEYLLQLAINKRRAIRQECTLYGINYNPLVIIQLPSMSEELIEKIEHYLGEQGFTYDNGLLSIWLADRKENVDGIADNDAKQCFLIMKQAISTGWDCPRAKVLVKLRENMHEDFEIQTLGRIRRMPEAKHYGNDVLDNCYLYTLDDEYTEAVKQQLGRHAANVKSLFVRDEYRNFTLFKEVKNTDADNFAPREAFFAIYDFLVNKYDLAELNADNNDNSKANVNKDDNKSNINAHDSKDKNANVQSNKVDNSNKKNITNNENTKSSTSESLLKVSSFSNVSNMFENPDMESGIKVDPNRCREILEKNGYNFNSNITNDIVQGNAVELSKKNILKTKKITIQSAVDTYKNGHDLRHSINTICARIGMVYQYLSPILQRLFLANVAYPQKILNLTKKEFYAFIINNERKLEYDILDAVVQKRAQKVSLQTEFKKTLEFKFPERIIVKYNKKDSALAKMPKNVYYEYPNTTIKSEPERKFEKYCEESSKIKFWYKNGESSEEFFSVVYLDKMNKAWTFYPDYIVGDIEGNIWIIETKGGEDTYGYSRNIDIKVENKFEALKEYANKYNLKWGFVRDINDDIFISNADEYVENMKDPSWKKIQEVL